MLFVLAARVFPQRSGASYAVMMFFSTAGNSLSPALIGAGVNNVETTFVICAALALAVAAGGGYAARRYVAGAAHSM